MENKIITMASKKFGTVRKMSENGRVLFCGADVAKALGYANPRDALARHCKGVLKRNATTSSVVKHDAPISCGTKEMSFIPEADVYRLICHSKLPSALEFEKWVFEDVVPKAVDDKLNAAPEQLTLETSEYHYFPKTHRGEPVITTADFAHFTGINIDAARCFVKRYCKLGTDYYLLEREALAGFKMENPEMRRMCGALIVMTKSAVDKLVKYYNCVDKVPVMPVRAPSFPAIEEKKEKSVVKPVTSNVNECIIALGVLGVVRDTLKKTENREAEEAVNVAIKYTSWELSRRVAQ